MPRLGVPPQLVGVGRLVEAVPALHLGPPPAGAGQHQAHVLVLPLRVPLQGGRVEGPVDAEAAAQRVGGARAGGLPVLEVLVAHEAVGRHGTEAAGVADVTLGAFFVPAAAAAAARAVRHAVRRRQAVPGGGGGRRPFPVVVARHDLLDEDPAGAHLGRVRHDPALDLLHDLPNDPTPDLPPHFPNDLAHDGVWHLPGWTNVSCNLHVEGHECSGGGGIFRLKVIMVLLK